MHNCIQCGKSTTNSKFCNRSCAAKFNNSKRLPRSLESRKKTSMSMTNRLKDNKERQCSKKFSVVCFHACIVCNKIICSNSHIPRKKTCSRECKIHASVGNRTYTNGRRLNIYYYNKHEQKEILLESSWEQEIAKWLDELNIVWIRPKPIKWFDTKTNKIRLYYPDFYLPEKNLYLDPKNPTAIALSLHKMNTVEKLIPLVYGSVEHIKEVVGMERF